MKTYSYPRSQEIFRRASKVIPSGIYGHLGPSQGCFIPVQAYPFFVERAKGAYFWDVDGNRFIDYMCAYGPNVLGYNDPDVDEAVSKQMAIGNCTTLPTTKMIELAELLVDTVASADWAFFAKNGGDVTSFALMTARAATNRPKVILFHGGYHGVAPWAQKLGYPGITAADTENNIYVHWNNYAEIQAAVRDNPGQIACLMATPYHHPIFEDNQLPAEGFWEKVRKLCTDNGIVLAIDDVRCGFRLDNRGSDYYYGFKADLICFCKALANGWNVSALCGTDSLKEAASGVMYTGSYWLSSAPFAAAIATVAKLRELDGAKLMLAQGRKLTAGLREIGLAHGFDLRISGEPSMWFMRIANDDNMLLHQEWVAECVRRGAFFTNHHNLFINCAIRDEDIEHTFAIAEDAFKTVKERHPEIF